jgi:hypothetical protein
MGDPWTRAQYETYIRTQPDAASALDRGWLVILECHDCDYEDCHGWRLGHRIETMLGDVGLLDLFTQTVH